MVAALLLIVAMSVFQLALGLYVRNTMISAASEGARYGARADASPTDGAARTRTLLTESLSPSYATDISVRRTSVDGVAVVEVTVSAPLPLIGLIGPSSSLTVSSRAFAEDQQLTTGAP